MRVQTSEKRTVLGDGYEEAEQFPEIDLTGIPLCGKTALMTGITGQDGSYLAELLLSKVRGGQMPTAALNNWKQ